jgi:pantothenate kinase type III
MLLAIEQGNTNGLFAIHDGDHWIAQWRSATEPSRTADECAVWLSQLMAMHKLELGLLCDIERRAAVNLQPAKPVATLPARRAVEAVKLLRLDT